MATKDFNPTIEIDKRLLLDIYKCLYPIGPFIKMLNNIKETFEVPHFDMIQRTTRELRITLDFPPSAEEQILDYYEKELGMG